MKPRTSWLLLFALFLLAGSFLTFGGTHMGQWWLGGLCCGFALSCWYAFLSSLDRT